MLILVKKWVFFRLVIRVPVSDFASSKNFSKSKTPSFRVILFYLIWVKWYRESRTTLDCSNNVTKCKILWRRVVFAVWFEVPQGIFVRTNWCQCESLLLVIHNTCINIEQDCSYYQSENLERSDCILWPITKFFLKKLDEIKFRQLLINHIIKFFFQFIPHTLI